MAGKRSGRQPTRDELKDWASFTGEVDPSSGSGRVGGAARTKRSDHSESPPVNGAASGRRVTTPDDLSDWNAFVETGMLPAEPTKAPVARKFRQAGPGSAVTLGRFEIGSALPKQDEIGTSLIQDMETAGHMDRNIARQMRSGRMDPERVLDLHGCRRTEAEQRLRNFVLGSRTSSRRLVLVITGKGQRTPKKLHDGEKGILRRHVPEWLSSPPLDRHVLYFGPAHPVHGGSGAFYVYLRRMRR